MAIPVCYVFKNLLAFLTLQIGGHEAADINSTELEKLFLADNKDVLEFTAGSHSYSLSFEGKQRIWELYLISDFCVLKVVS